MELITPNYYHRFQCIAAACPDSCCKEWVVDVDADTAALYRALPGALGDRLRQVLQDTEDGIVMTIEDGRCPMWREDGLCRIQAELGHDTLCRVCREFPRLRHDYGDFVELGLELSCPEAAHLILSADDDGITITHLPDEEPSNDPETLDILSRSRKAALSFLCSNTYSLPQILAILLLYGHDVQAEIDGDIPAVLEPEVLWDEVQKYAGNADMPLLFSFFQGLEILTPSWKDLLSQKPTCSVWSVQIRNFAKYLVRRYWLQAVSDLDLVCRVKYIVAACLLISAMPGDTISNAQLFSKEVENNPDNLDAVLDGTYTATALTDAQLLALLLTP